MSSDEQEGTGAGGEFLVVGIGASAGGIAPLKEFFARVEPASGLAYVVILHLSPTHESRLAEVLQTVTPLPVTQVTETVRVEPNRVYVIPQDRSLTISDGALSLSRVAGYEERRAPVDIFLRALAESHGERAVGVILSGTGADGSMGLKRVKEHGGLVIAQDPEEAEFSDMPRHAIATGLVDYVLPVAGMPAQVAAYAERVRRSPVEAISPEREADSADERALRDILTQLRVRTGHDFTNYKRGTLLRRVARRIHVHGLPDMAAYARYMREHAAEPAALLRDLLISVTNFFRDGAAFDALRAKVIARLFADRGEADFVRVWVPGCATGEEAYSIAMLLAERERGAPAGPTVQVFASDLDKHAVSAAREGFYTLNDVADVPPEFLSRYFVKEPDGFRVRKELREMVLFAHHNVIKDPPFSHIDLVSCRNLLIYLNRAAQQRLLEIFHFALNPGGFLFLGGSESVDGAGSLFVPLDGEARIYESREAAPRGLLPVPDPTSATQFKPALTEARLQAEIAPPAARRPSYADLHLRLLEQYAPPSAVVNEEYEVLHLTESAGRYMRVAGGEPSRNLLQLVRPELRLDLRTALYQAAHQRANVETGAIRFAAGERAEAVNVVVRPVLRDEDTARGFFLVFFEPKGDGAGAAAEAGDGERVVAVRAADTVAPRLEEEIGRLKAQLAVTAEQYETSVEELRASNEELQAMNEELRSAAEELETSKEELQSINEELTTVNQELKIKIEELSHANNHLQNLINSTRIATVFLDRSLRVKLFTPPASRLFNLLPVDAGRRLADITHNFDYEDLSADAEHVIATLQAKQREVVTADGRVHLMYMLPYRTTDDRIEGVVLTFLDITERKRAEEALRRSEERLRRVLETAALGVIFFDHSGTIIDANSVFLEMTGYTRADVESGALTWRRMTPPEWLAESEAQMERMAATGHIGPYEKEYILKDGSRRWMLFAGRDLGDGTISEYCIDITDRRRAEKRLRESEEKYRTLFDSIDEGFCTAEVLFDEGGRAVDYRFLQVNPAFERQTGIADAAGRRMREIAPRHEDYWFEMYGRVALTGEPARFENEAAQLGRWFDVYAFRVEDPQLRHVGALLKDVTERRRADEQLRLSEQRLRSIVEGVTEYAIITQDADGIIETWNTGAERVFGYAAEEAVGRGIEIIFTPEDRAAGAHLEEMRRARETGRASDERWHVRKDGSRFYVSGVLSTFGEGAPTGFVKIARDLTRQKQADDALRRAHDELEARVRERTMELAESNVALQSEVRERAAAEENVKNLLRQLVTIQEDERRRIARDLHDHLGQQLTALRLNLESLRQASDATAREQVEQAQSLAARIDGDVDFLAWELRPAALDDLGLKAALSNFVKEFSSHFGIDTRFHSRRLARKRLAPEIETNLYRIAQEALNNVHKHARAKGVDVLLELRGGEVVLIVEDDGRGFDQVEAAADGGGDRGLGLVGMRERAAICGGTVEIETAPGRGTTVFARAPARFADRPARRARKGSKRR